MVMDKKDAARKIWKECFGYSDTRISRMLDAVCDDNDILLLEKGGQPVSTLEMRRFDFLFHGEMVGLSMISHCATRRSSRGNGFMSELMMSALEAARRRGDMIAALVPTHDWLSFLFGRWGFSTVFYHDIQRFTSLHTFGNGHGYHPVDNPASDEVYMAFREMEMQRPCTLIVSRRDFQRRVMESVGADATESFVAMADSEGRVVSMAWASLSADGELLTVTDLLGVDTEAIRAAMHELRRMYHDVAVRIMALPGDGNRHLYGYGMARIVDVGRCLSAVAAAYPELCTTMRVTDRIIPDNSHYYVIKNGSLYLADERTDAPAFDITAEVLCRMAFSSPKIGSVLGFPSVRPVL